MRPRNPAETILASLLASGTECALRFADGDPELHRGTVVDVSLDGVLLDTRHRGRVLATVQGADAAQYGLPALLNVTEVR